jgi:tetratricopeptide (TPR) repeat protein
MRADAAGNREEALTFLPMAIAAHDLARPLDLDGLFHLALLHQTGGDWAAALAVAREGLERDPNHLLALAAAAASAREMGDMESAGELYRHFLEVLDAERLRALPEYVEHQFLIDNFRDIARAFPGG